MRDIEDSIANNSYKKRRIFYVNIIVSKQVEIEQLIYYVLKI